MEKRIMKTFFANSGRLVCCRPTPQSGAQAAEILDLVLNVYGRQDLREVCSEVLERTTPLQTVADCGLLGAKELPVPEEFLAYLDMKAQYLREYDVQTVQHFDRQMLKEDTLRYALIGDSKALRFLACLDWLDGNQERAVRCWTILAYIGDGFAMRALEYACENMDDSAAAEHWRNVRSLCEEADKKFSMTIPKAQQDGEAKKAAETAQMILAVRSRMAEHQGKGVPMAMVQYAIDSGDDLTSKMRNLYSTHEHYSVMLVKERSHEEKKYGF